MSEKLPQLVMIYPDLSVLPELRLPDGYTARSLRAGEEAKWEGIVSEAFRHPFRFDKLSAVPIYSPERVLFVCDADDNPAATATAWHSSRWGDECGYLHMVGVLAAHGGRGLGAQVSLAALYAMKREGRTKAVLHTDDFRVPAVRTYLKLGFIPYFDHESHPARWKAIAEQLGDAGLASRLASMDDPDAPIQT